MEIKIQKLIILPICTVYDDNGNMTDEKRLNPVTHFTARDLNIKELVARLEEKANASFGKKA